MVERRVYRPQLIQFVREELEQFNSGNITSISTSEELRERFGYGNRNGVYRSLSKAGLTPLRNAIFVQLEELETENFIQPSPEWAWMIAVLSFGGHVSPKAGKVILTSCEDIEVKEKFTLLGERLLGVNANPVPVNRENRDEYEYIEFYSIKASRAIGETADESWIETVKQKHAWILSDPQFVWAFLEGAYEIRGYANPDPKGVIQFNTSSRAETNFIASLLLAVGIENVGLRKKINYPEGIKGIYISRAPDAIRFAQGIHSVIPDKERRLEYFRQLNPQRIYRIVTSEEVIAEWRRLKLVLGHAPSSDEIQRLKNAGQTSYNPHVYSYHFGKTDTLKRGISFTLARDNMEAYFTNKKR